jgi:hypothetical protein
MFKRITLMCALLAVVAFLAGSAYAEVQNIRVSGDITAMGVVRDNYDLEDAVILQGDQPGVYQNEDTDSLFMSLVRLRVDADLTDNVSATVRLANLREWDAANAEDEEVVVDLAYVVLKEMLYSPLTLVIGRQDLMYGKGLIVGGERPLANNPNNVKYLDLSILNGFDAVRAILDYDPWTINLLLAKMSEDDDTASTNANTATNQDRDSDTDLYGVNVGYLFDQYDAEMEGYFFTKRDESSTLTIYYPTDGTSSVDFEDNLVHTFGLRGSFVPMENLTIGAEVAGQFGEMQDNTGNILGNSSSRDREAMLAYASGKYDFVDVRFTPMLSLEYLYLSGEEIDPNRGEDVDTSDFEGWHPIYRGYAMSTIRDSLETTALTNDPADTSGFTNQHTIKAACTLDLGELIDGLSLDLAFLHYWFAEEPSYDNRDDDIGNELNAQVVYDYTEDVKFVLDAALFMPGEYYDEVHNSRVLQGAQNNLGLDAVGNRVSNDNAVSVVGICIVDF